ncbi:hypothetical protein JCM5350_002317 [Sporobolomyces pararoseus]
MFGSLASTSTSTSSHFTAGDPFAFLDTGKQYVTMIREVLPLRASPSTSKKLSPPSFSSSSSTYSNTSSSWTSLSDTAFSSDDDEDELQTPPASPQNSSSLKLFHDHKGKSNLKQSPGDSSILQFSFSPNEISEDDDARGEPTFDWISPPALPSPPVLPTLSDSTSPSLDESLSVPLPAFSLPPKPKPSAAQLPPLTPPLTQAQNSPASTPRRPTRAEEERYRGRTRSPRLLWRSELDKPSIELLNLYHEETVGGKLPLLKPGMRTREVREWSRRVEEAGI